MITHVEAFERAFLAVSYLVGNKRALPALAHAGAAAHRVAERLGAPERVDRARHLSSELAPLMAALGERGLR